MGNVCYMKNTAKVKEKIKKVLWFFANPRLWLCLGLAWIITNGWSYILIGIGTALDITWMKVVASGYLAFLWFPITPEKIVTVAIAIFLMKLIFPKDEKTLAVLSNWYEKAKEKHKRKKHDCDYQIDEKQNKE